MEFKWLLQKVRRCKTTLFWALTLNNLSTRNQFHRLEYRKAIKLQWIQPKLNGFRASNGVAIYIKSDYPCKQITITTHLKALALYIKFKETEIYLCNIYLSNQHSFSEKNLENIKQLPKPFIMTAIIWLNILWESQKTDNRGKEIEIFLENNNLVLLNHCISSDHFPIVIQLISRTNDCNPNQVRWN